MMSLQEERYASKRFIRGLVQGDFFDEMEFLKQTSRIPTADLVRVISSSVEEIQEELNDIVKSEFSAFVKLFQDIGQVGNEEISNFHTRLVDIGAKLQLIEQGCNENSSLLSQNIENFLVNIHEQKKIRFLARFSNDIERVENLLPVIESCKQTDLDVELLAEFVLKLKAIVNASAGNIDIPETLIQRFVTISTNFYSSLEIKIQKCINEANFNEFQLVVSIFVRNGHSKNIIATFANEFLKPRLAKIISKNKFEELKRVHCEKALEHVLEDVLTFCKGMKRDWFSSKSTEPLLVQCILIPIFQKLSKEIPFIFSPALPDLFSQYFRSSCQFLEDLSKILTSRDLAILEGDTDFQTFCKSWQLHVYYQIRFRDICQLMEKNLQNVEITPDSQVVGDFIIENLKETCSYIASKEVALKPLGPKFFKLQLQSLNRVFQWLQEKLEDYTKGDELCIEDAWTCISIQQRIISKMPDFIHLKASIEMPNQEECLKIQGRLFHELQKKLEISLDSLKNDVTKAVFRNVSEMTFGNPGPFNLMDPLISLHRLDSDTIGSEFYTEISNQFLTKFSENANQLILQSRKMVANQKRLRAIMKEEEDETESVNIESNAIEQQRRLCSSLKETIESIQEGCTWLDQCNKELLLQLKSLHQELRAYS